MKAVTAVLDDLFFNVKIADAAKRAGLDVRFVKTEDAALERLRTVPSIVVVDLNCASTDPIALIQSVKADFPGTAVIGFVSHVQTDLRDRAQVAGCDVVLARSVVSARLPELLRQYAA